jgi:hypothetical protein
MPPIDGVGHAKTLGYLDVLRDGKAVGRSVAIVGAGGIGFDVAEFLVHRDHGPRVDADRFFAEWGVDQSYSKAGGLRHAQPEPAARHVHLLQRKASKVGDGLGKTTGWIHRTALKARGVGMSSAVTYRRIDDDGLHVTIADAASGQRGDLRRAGAVARTRGATAGRRMQGAPDWRRIRSCRARCEARDSPGHDARRDPLRPIRSLFARRYWSIR